MTSSSLTRVLSVLLACKRPSYVCGGSKCLSLSEEVLPAPGEGWRRCNEGSDGDGWKVCSDRETPSNMCCGAILDGWCNAGVVVRLMGELE